MVTRALDVVLDRALLGYGNVGYAVRRRGWAPLPSMEGEVVIVTGAKAGLGRAMTAGLARLGATVHMVVRGREEGERVRGEIEREVPGARLVVDECDVSLLADARAYAEGFSGPLHALIHNAGVMPPTRRETAEGNELSLATHVLGPHALTRALRPSFERCRVLWVSSGGMYTQRLRVDDLQYRGSEFNGTRAYARTKRMQVVLSGLWAEELRGTGDVSHAGHPGWVATPGIASHLPRFAKLTRPILRDLDQGADTFVWLAAAREPGESSGRFWHDREPRPEHYLPTTRESAEDRRALWRAVEALT